VVGQQLLMGGFTIGDMDLVSERVGILRYLSMTWNFKLITPISFLFGDGIHYLV
jgi:hypothetical protein